MCQAWEATAEEVERTCDGATRVVVLRLGIVLDRDGGALGKMLPTFQIFAGDRWAMARSGSRGCTGGRGGIVVESPTNPEMRGPVNVTAPNPVRMGRCARRWGRTLGRPSWHRCRTCHRALLGRERRWCAGAEGGTERALKAGYKFKYERIDDALQNILR